MTNVNLQELEKFDQLADDWWNLNGSSGPLHQLNPCRLAFIEKYSALKGKQVLDIGCGGGILTESLAKAGAKTIGIDLSERLIKVAKSHAEKNNLMIDYQLIHSTALAEQKKEYFDVITCMELLEHVPDPQALIHDCATLLKPGGQVFFSTINRQPKAYLFAILGAEYLLKKLPRGTHDYQQFIRPSELDAACTEAGLTLTALSGMSYHLGKKIFSLSADVSINYLACCKK